VSTSLPTTGPQQRSACHTGRPQCFPQGVDATRRMPLTAPRSPSTFTKDGPSAHRPVARTGKACRPRRPGRGTRRMPAVRSFRHPAAETTARPAVSECASADSWRSLWVAHLSDLEPSRTVRPPYLSQDPPSCTPQMGLFVSFCGIEPVEAAAIAAQRLPYGVTPTRAGRQRRPALDRTTKIGGQRVRDRHRDILR
jgi:hypothetical protein